VSFAWSLYKQDFSSDKYGLELKLPFSANVTHSYGTSYTFVIQMVKNGLKREM
jgi:hypothetical protein